MVLREDGETSLYCPRGKGQWFTVALRSPKSAVLGPAFSGYSCVQAMTEDGETVRLRTVEPVRVNPAITNVSGYTSKPPRDAVCVLGACNNKKVALPLVSYFKMNLDSARLDDISFAQRKDRESVQQYIREHDKDWREKAPAGVRRRPSAGCSSCNAVLSGAAHKKAAKAYRSGRTAWAIMVTALVLLGLGLIASAVVVGLQLAKSARSLRAASGLHEKRGASANKGTVSSQRGN